MLRRPTVVNRLVRNTAVAAGVKKLYEDTCQICGLRLETPGGAYSEAAHVRPLGTPHAGPDALSNMLCLCPNCHVLFDNHALTVNDEGTVLKLGIEVGKLFVKKQHALDFAHLSYQRKISEASSH